MHVCVSVHFFTHMDGLSTSFHIASSPGEGGYHARVQKQGKKVIFQGEARYRVGRV